MNFLFATGYQLQTASWLGVDPCDVLVTQARTLQWHPQQTQKETVTKMRDISCRGWQGCCHKTFLIPRKWSGFQVTLTLSHIFTTAHRQMNKSILFTHYLAVSSHHPRTCAGPVQCPQASHTVPKVASHTLKGRGGGRESPPGFPNAVSSLTGSINRQHLCDSENRTQTLPPAPRVLLPVRLLGNHGLLL